MVGNTRDSIFRVLSTQDSHFPVPSLLFQVARIPPPKGEWGIRLPPTEFYWHTGKPGTVDTISYKMQVYPDTRVHTKGEMADCTCMVKPAITLLYSHIYTPAIK